MVDREMTVNFSREQLDEIVASTARRLRLDADRIREEGRRAGWAEAIAALRGREVWRADDPHDEFGTGQFVVLSAAADYLADQAPKEETHD